MIYLKLMISFLKVGLLGIGGGYGMIALIQKDASLFGISNGEFLDVAAIAEMTPGPLALNLATYTGYKIAGVLGAIVSTFCVVLPPFIIIYFIIRFFYIFRANKHIVMFLNNFRPIVIALVITACIVMARGVKLYTDYKGILIFLGTFITGHKYKLHPLLSILISGIIGFLIYN